jgi:hypothetical protein
MLTDAAQAVVGGVGRFVHVVGDAGTGTGTGTGTGKTSLLARSSRGWRGSAVRGADGGGLRRGRSSARRTAMCRVRSISSSWRRMKQSYDKTGACRLAADRSATVDVPVVWSPVMTMIVARHRSCCRSAAAEWVLDRTPGRGGHELGTGGHVELGVDAAEVRFDGAPRDVEALGDLGVGAALGDEAEDGGLRVRQAVPTV